MDNVGRFLYGLRSSLQLPENRRFLSPDGTFFGAHVSRDLRPRLWSSSLKPPTSPREFLSRFGFGFQTF